MPQMGQLELVLELLADLVLVVSQRLKELAMNVVSLKRMNHLRRLLVLAVVPEVAPVVPLLVQEEPGLLEELVERLVLVPVAEVSE
jgi:hypothetical protein